MIDSLVIRKAFDEWLTTVTVPRGSSSERLLFSAWFQGWIQSDKSARLEMTKDLNSLIRHVLSQIR